MEEKPPVDVIQDDIEYEPEQNPGYIDVVSAEEQQLELVGNEVEVVSEHRSVTEQSLPQMIDTLFYSKLSLQERTFCTTRADVAVNICTPSIADGYMFFDELHALAGPRLIRECKNYAGMQHASCRVTRSYNATNFKCNHQYMHLFNHIEGLSTGIIHTTLPQDLSNRRVIDVELAQTAIRRCLNEAVARGATTIAFPGFFPTFSPIVGIEFVLKVISNWMFVTEQKGELGKLQDIQILCHSPNNYRLYRGMIRKLAIDFYEMVNGHVQSSGLFDVHAVVIRDLKKRGGRRNAYSGYDNYADYNDDYEPEQKRRTRRSRRNDSMPPIEPLTVQLELSAKLQPSVLVLDDKDGMKRQYRLTNKSKDGRKLYFRCSYCDTLIRKTNVPIRAKITLQDGVIVGDQYPEHHPDCKPKNQEELMVQQLDRKSRREVKEGRLAPKEAYQQAYEAAKRWQQRLVDEGGPGLPEKAEDLEDEENVIVDQEVDDGEEPVRKLRRHRNSDPSGDIVPNFPAWQQIRQQYFRMRKVGESKKQKLDREREEMMQTATFVIPDEDDMDMVVDVGLHLE